VRRPPFGVRRAGPAVLPTNVGLLAAACLVQVLSCASVADAAVPKPRTYKVCIDQVGSPETIGDLNVRRGVCKRKAIPISFVQLFGNVQFLPGPQGPTGPSGPAGPAGPPGATGSSPRVAEGHYLQVNIAVAGDPGPGADDRTYRGSFRLAQ
jgi:hypothetical protein